MSENLDEIKNINELSAENSQIEENSSKTETANLQDIAETENLDIKTDDAVPEILEEKISHIGSKHSDNKTFSVSEFFDWMEIIITAMVTVILIFTLAFRVATIDGSSMVNTLHHGEKVLLCDLFYTPKNGDIVVISRNYNSDPDLTDRNSQPIIKRVIATEGQSVSIDFNLGVVYVDGEKLNENYTYTPTNNPIDFPTDGSSVTVPKGCVFVLGENRNNSLVSRSKSIGNLGNGMVDTRYIIGRAVARIFPFSGFGGLY